MTENTVQSPPLSEGEYKTFPKTTKSQFLQKISFVAGIVIFLLVLLVLESSGIYKITNIFKFTPFQVFQKSYQNEIVQLDSILSSINSIPQPLDPKATQEQFSTNKEEVDTRVKAIKKALEDGRVDDAIKVIGELRPAINAFGDPMKGRFIPKEIRDSIDPEGIVLKRTDRVDPNPLVMEPFLATFKIELALRNK